MRAKTRKQCPACSRKMVNVKRSRPVSVGRSRVMLCLGCGHRWTSVEMTAEFIRDHVLRGDPDAIRSLVRLVDANQR